MSSRKLRPTLVALALAVALVLGPTLSQAAGLNRSTGAELADQSSSSPFFSAVWSFFQSVWGGANASQPGGQSVDSDNGGKLDPDGVLVDNDNGGKLDPDG